MKSVAVSRDLQFIIAGSISGELILWSLNDAGKQKFWAHSVQINSIVTLRSMNRDIIISASSDGTLKFWDLNTLEVINTIDGHRLPISSFAIAGSYIVTASYDGTLKLWSLETLTELTTFSGHKGCVMDVVITHEHKHVVSASSDNTLKVWDLRSGKEKATLEGHTDSVNAIKVIDTCEGLYAISGAEDATLGFWSLNSYDELLTMEMYPKDLYEYSDIVWEIATGRALSSFRFYKPLCNCVITQDGKKVIALASSGWLYVLNLQKLSEENLYSRSYIRNPWAMNI